MEKQIDLEEAIAAEAATANAERSDPNYPSEFERACIEVIGAIARGLRDRGLEFKEDRPISRQLLDFIDGYATIQVTSEGAFREGARVMREAITSRLESLERYCVAAPIVVGVPLPTYTPPAAKPASEDWGWWSGDNEEHFTNGPFATREHAIDELDGYGGHIVEAIRGRVSFSAVRLIENQYFDNDDYFSGDYGEPERRGGADVIAQADAELQALLDAWLDRWRHTFVTPEMFVRSRNNEYVPEDAESVE